MVPTQTPPPGRIPAQYLQLRNPVPNVSPTTQETTATVPQTQPNLNNPGNTSVSPTTLDTGLGTIQRLPTPSPGVILGNRPVVNPNVKPDKHFRIYVSKDRFFEMDMLPAVRQNLSHPHGLAGQPVPGAPPGVTFTQLQNTANIPIPGGAPVVQSLGVNMMTMQFVGAFIGLPRFTESSSDPYWTLQRRDDFDCSLHANKEEKGFYDDPYSDPQANRYPGRAVLNRGDESWHVSYLFSRDIVAEQKEVQVSIVTHNYLSVKETGVITQFVPMLTRNDRVYYKFTLLITDYYNELYPRIPSSYVLNPFSSSSSGSSTTAIPLVPASSNSPTPESRPF